MKRNTNSSYSLPIRVLCIVLAALMLMGAAVLTFTFLFSGLGL